MMLQGLARTDDGASPGGTKVVAIGPVPPVSASEYLPRVNLAVERPAPPIPDVHGIGVLAVTCAIERQLPHLQSPKRPVWKRPPS
jgi:hypothetical protein